MMLRASHGPSGLVSPTPAVGLSGDMFTRPCRTMGLSTLGLASEQLVWRSRLFALSEPVLLA